jgi:hypothetical protein
MVEKRQKSRSDSQQDAERSAREAFGREIGVALERGSRQGMDFDGVFDDGIRVVLVEITAQIGRQRGAQAKKICTDVLKLGLARALLQANAPHTNIETYLVFIEADAMRLLEGDAWAARAAAHYNVTPRLVTIAPEIKAAVRDAKIDQDLRQP